MVYEYWRLNYIYSSFPVHFFILNQNFRSNPTIQIIVLRLQLELEKNQKLIIPEKDFGYFLLGLRQKNDISCEKC